MRATCVNHRAREAVGICVRCRTQICSECVTKADGINYCVRCFSALADDDASAPSQVTESSPVVSWVSLIVLVGLLWAACWVALTAALPGWVRAL